MSDAGPFMSEALRLAAAVQGTTSPNPNVGAVVVHGGNIIGGGATQPPGGPHAEVMALRAAGERARGAAVWVTLEPCSVHGRTPPCTKALIEAGVSEVHCALYDPDERVRGRGVQELRRAGIRVTVGEGAEASARLLEGFITQRTLGRPLVVAKFAASLDGRIAAVGGDARWVSGPPARAWVHRQRAVLDAILVGSGTVLADNPLLTARPETGSAPRQPLRVVVDARGRTPLDAAVLGPDAPTLIATTERSDRSWRTAAAAAGARVTLLPASADGHVEPAALLAELGQRGVLSLLVEGGATLLGSLLDEGLIDKVHAVIAPLLVGGAAPVAVGGRGVTRMADAARLHDLSYERLGDDMLVTGYLRRLPLPQPDPALGL